MLQQAVDLIERAVDSTVTTLGDGLVAAVPRVITAIVIIAIAAITIWVVQKVLRAVLSRVYPRDQTLVIDLVSVVVSIVLWFAVALLLLKVLGLDEIAASIGTSVGFIALGISYALSDMIEDTVAGVYLLRDPDFNIGDTIETEKATGEVVTIGLRKSRFRLEDGDIAVIANRNVESRWTRQAMDDS